MRDVELSGPVAKRWWRGADVVHARLPGSAEERHRSLGRSDRRRHHQPPAGRGDTAQDREAGGRGPSGGQRRTRDQQSAGVRHQPAVPAAHATGRWTTRARWNTSTTAQAELARVAHITQQTLRFYRQTASRSEISNIPEILHSIVQLYQIADHRQPTSRSEHKFRGTPHLALLWSASCGSCLPT